MKQKRLLPFLSLLFAMALSMTGFAQQVTVTGKIVDSKTGAPLAGATIKVKNSNTAVNSEVDGTFSIKAPSSESVITVTYVGYKVFETKAGNGNISVSLTATDTDLNEVVVVGYGTQKKIHTTGSVASLNMKAVEDLPVASLSEAIKGQIVGVSVSGGYARPGEAATITIRNPIYFSKDGGSKEPLYVIDDIIRTKTDFDLIDVSEIESFSVLKDAAAAIYGILGSNGVIVVKTKRGKAGANNINYSSSFGTTDAIVRPKMMNGFQMASYLNEYNVLNPSVGNGRFDSTKSNFYFPDELDYFRTHNYDWLDQAWQKAFQMRHTVNISGGTEKATYFAGMSYDTQNSNFDGSNFNRYSFRASTDIKLATGLKLSLSLSSNLSDKKNTFSKQGSEDLNNDWRILLTMPQFNPYSINGKFVLIPGVSGGSSSVSNYNYFAIHSLDNYTSTKGSGTNFNAALSYDIPFIKGLRAAASFNKNISNSWGKQYGTKYDEYQFVPIGGNKHLLDTVVQTKYTISNGDRVRLNPTYTENYQFNGSLAYDRQFGRHQVSAFAGYEQSESFSDGLAGMIDGVLVGGLDNMNFATGVQTTNETISEAGRLAYIGRFNYSFASKYLFEAQFRADASLNFAPENRWAKFPSFSAGWVVSEEKFFDGIKGVINYMKIRGSAGFLGLDATKSYQWAKSYAIQTGKAAVFGGNGDRGLAAVTNIDLANRDVHWDNVDKYNAGIDFKFINNHLSLSLDAWYDKRYNMLSNLTAAPSILIGTPIPSENWGAANNFGWEGTANWSDNINRDWRYSIQLNFGWNDNKVLITDFAKGNINTYLDPTGKSSDMGFLGYKSIGILHTQAEVDALLAKTPGYTIFGYAPKPGMLAFKDIRGPKDAYGVYTAPDGKITVDDQDYLNKHNDNHYGVGFNWSLTYKTLSLRVTMGANWGGIGSIESSARKAGSLSLARPLFWNDHWTPANTDAAYPAPYYTYTYDLASDFWWRSSFSCRISNLNLSYTIPQDWIKKAHFNSARLFLVATNPINFFNPYDYKDNNSGSFDVFPTLKSYSLGLNINL